jgi:hypothetical protein
MTAVRSVIVGALFTAFVGGCTTAPGQAGSAGNDQAVQFVGEAEFGSNAAFQGRLADVLVTWLESPSQAKTAGDTGSLGEDRLPIVVAQDETRIFAMEDANGQPNTMQLLDAGGTVQAETGPGKAPAMVKLKAGTYTLVIRRAAGVSGSDDMVSVVMPLQRVVKSSTKAIPTPVNPQITDAVTSPVSFAVNSQITDAVAQANVKVIGDAPAIAMGNLYQATAQALANAAHNATNAQQQAYVTSQAATTMGVATLYSLDTAATGIATAKILK